MAKERIRRFILQTNHERGTTILLTTHDLSDVEKVSKRVVIIDHGQLLYDGKLDLLRDRFGDKRQLIVDFAEKYDPFPINSVEITNREGSRVTFQFTNHEISASQVINRLSAQFRIRDLEVREPDIKTTIRRIYEGKLLE